jgi:crossover junction endodeoxyribonuclease RuvC
MKIISIDPGYERVGIAVLEKINGKEIVIFSECFKTKPGEPLNERILLIGKRVEKIIDEFQPEAMAIEKLYFTSNQKTAMGVSEARGVIINEAKQKGLKVFEYTPLQVKIAVASYGKATKSQVISMVRKLVKISDKTSSDDEIDAIAIGLTCLASER